MMESVTEVAKVVLKETTETKLPDVSRLPDIFDPREDLPDWGESESKIPQFTKEDVTLASKDVGEQRDIKSNGPEDQAFDNDKNAPLERKGEKCSELAIRGKPMPDGVSINDNSKTTTYWEDKRPSESKDGGNSWLSTYKNDPIATDRVKARDDYRDGKITKAEAEAKVIISEHDDHYAKKDTQWENPNADKTQGYQDKLGIRMPDTEVNQGRIAGLEKELAQTGRNPEVTRENGIAYIKYDTKL